MDDLWEFSNLKSEIYSIVLILNFFRLIKHTRNKIALDLLLVLYITIK